MTNNDRRMNVWLGVFTIAALCVIVGSAQRELAAQTGGTLLNVVFDDGCDGMRLRLLNQGTVLGRHTGCNAGELATGSQFAGNGETGVSVTFYQRSTRLLVRYDIYQTGFRAGRFYAYVVRTGQLIRQGTYSSAP